MKWPSRDSNLLCLPPTCSFTLTEKRKQEREGSGGGSTEKEGGVGRGHRREGTSEGSRLPLGDLWGEGEGGSCLADATRALLESFLRPLRTPTWKLLPKPDLASQNSELADQGGVKSWWWTQWPVL